MKLFSIFILILTLNACSSKKRAPASSDALLEETTSNEVKNQYLGDQISGLETTTKKELGTYIVKPGDTLMLISYQIYGKINHWRQILKLNSDILGTPEDITTGQNLRYEYPDKVYDWKVQGEPYLILRGDSLSKISKKVYYSTERWKDIFDNNTHLIKNPNLIWAGFTLHYLPDTKVSQF